MAQPARTALTEARRARAWLRDCKTRSGGALADDEAGAVFVEGTAGSGGVAGGGCEDSEAS